jgi:hypothetical protein
MATLKDKEFLLEIQELRQSLRRDMEAHAIGLDPSPAAIAERRRRVLVDWDFKFFAYTYFPHHVYGETSIFQAHFCHRYPQLLKRETGAIEWWKAPRGEGKSSFATKIGPVFVAVLGLLQREEIRRDVGWTGDAPRFIDYGITLGAEASLPAKLLEVVKAELLINAALELDFPEVVGRTKQWKIGEFTTRTGVKFESRGADQAVRGTFHNASRPKILWGDDLITDAEAKSDKTRKARWDWLTKSIEYLGPPDGSLIFIGVGTTLHKDDPISRAARTIGHITYHFKALVKEPDNKDLWHKCVELMLNEDKPFIEAAAEQGIDAPDETLPSYQFYLANREAMDAGAVTSWPSVRSLFWLMKQRAKSPTSFATEMQGDGRSDEDKIFTTLHFWVNRLNSWRMFGSCDPSMGRGQTSDPSAILAGGWNVDTKQLHIEYAKSKRRLPSMLGFDLIEFQKEFKCLAIGFENNNAYEHSRQTFIDAGLESGIVLPLIGVTASIPLELRIGSLEPFVTDKLAPKILIHSGLTQLIEQFEEWPEPPSGHHYDLLSGAHLLWHIASTRGAMRYAYESIGGRSIDGAGDSYRNHYEDEEPDYHERELF